jgi:hypothetical protein
MRLFLKKTGRDAILAPRTRYGMERTTSFFPIEHLPPNGMVLVLSSIFLCWLNILFYEVVKKYERRDKETCE